MNRLKGIIYDLVGAFARLGSRAKPDGRKLLIVRVDEIGDFMLWHRFIADIVQAEKFKGYRFYYCGNQSTRSLFETFDASYITEAFWLDKIRFKKEMRYRYGFLRRVYQQGFDTVINPTFSRDKRYDDSIVRAAQAREAIGMVANLESVARYEEGYDHALYTQLFHHPQKPVFEFYRNRLFTAFVTGEAVGTTSTRLPQDRLPVLSLDLPERYFVVFPGSRSSKRIWPAEYFARVASHLFHHTGATAVVCGTANDKPYIDAFCSAYDHPYSNLMGRTSLVEMLSVFSGATCLLSVDTGSVHLAAAVGCTVIGVFNGSQYGRFAPYPAELAPEFHAVYPDAVEQDIAEGNIGAYEFVVDVPYASVPAEKVILAAHRALAL